MTAAVDITQELILDDNEDNQRLARLNGQCDCNLRIVERMLDISIRSRGHRFYLSGACQKVLAGKHLLTKLYAETHRHTPDERMIQLLGRQAINHARNPVASDTAEKQEQQDPYLIKTPRKWVKARGKTQQAYLRNIHAHTVSFGIGPAGTGKTYLAVACAVQAFIRDEVQQVLLTRPAVEAGERLGFLPGDLSQKIDPYLRPLYDALNDMLGHERVEKMLERRQIEIAPLAFMRGRTLNDAFVILDEAQNTTPEQLKMLLTRIGAATRVVVTGDPSQTDLPSHQPSGLLHALSALNGVEGLSMTHFSSQDVVRHPVVQRIIEAYEQHDDG